jgi:hypothetical protein
MIHLVNNMYEWDPENVGSLHNIGRNLNRTANSLDSIDHNVRSIRDQIWANQFFELAMRYKIAESDNEREAKKLFVAKCSAVDEIIRDITLLLDKNISQSSEFIELGKELSKFRGKKYLELISFKSFLKFLNKTAPYFIDMTVQLCERYQMISKDNQTLHMKSEEIEIVILPGLEDSAEYYSNVSFKLEVMIDLIRAGIGLARMQAHYEELLEDTKVGMGKLKSKKIKLAFNLPNFIKAQDNLNKEYKLLETQLKKIGTNENFLKMEQIDLKSWIKKAEVRIESLCYAFETVFAKLDDFKRTYEIANIRRK